MFIAVSERLPAACGDETNVENLVKEVLGLFETRAFSGEGMWKKWLMVLYYVRMGNESLTTARDSLE